MKVMPGGIRLPSAPPAASDPSTMAGEYAVWRKYGSATAPIVAAVATLEPEIAENTLQDMMFVCSNPPGTRWNHRLSER